jgi:GNAT superfamily N-acetyltransferase
VTAQDAGPDLVAWADLNEAAGYEWLVRHRTDGAPAVWRRFGGCEAFPTGRGTGFFNPILITRRASPADLGAAIAWMRDQGSPLSLRIRDDLETSELAAIATELGLQRDEWVEQVMVMWPIRPAPALPPGLRIEVADAASIGRFHEAASASFFGGAAAGVDFMRDLFPPAMAEDPDARLFGGYLDGRPVASSVAFRSGSVVGVYSVATAEHARRRGIGSAMTWQAVEAGRRWGCEAATLQASAMGEPVYRTMGFETVAGYVTWSEPRRPAEPADEAANRPAA